jgi:hypothetical protein
MMYLVQMVPFSLENRVDGLIEARVFTLADLAAADSYAQTLADVSGKVVLRHGPVLCADHRPVVIYRQEVADRLATLFAAMNSRLTRVAVVVSRSNATLAMQLERIVREANFASRRVFYEASDAATFLSSALSPAAAERAKAFLGESLVRATGSPTKS